LIEGDQGMQIEANRVYLSRTAADSNVVASERYQELAYTALSCLDLELPAEGMIALKPNITIPVAPDTRIITHPGFIAGIIQRLLELGVAPERIAVLEGYSPRRHGTRKRRQHSPHRHFQRRPEHSATWKHPEYGELPEISGYADALDAFGLTLTNHDDSEGVQVQVPGGVVFQQLRFTHHAAEAAFLFNVPVAKCHNLSCTTLCTKNLQGLVMSPQRHMCGRQEEDMGLPEEGMPRLLERGISLHEERFCHKHADLVAAVRNTGVPGLCVVDGMVGRDGTAFNEGRNWPLGWTLIGQNETHVDTVGTYLFGLDPGMTPYLQVASERGLGTNRIEAIEVVDLATQQVLDTDALAAYRHDPPLMPLARCQEGYTARFRPDGSIVPWALDWINEQREKEGLEPIPAASWAN
jgi:uncharacterized protein (DUF362 family)